MAQPTLKVEIAFASDPLDDTPTWTDVSAYVRNDDVLIKRGRNDPWSPYQPGRARVRLSNRDRRFDPTHSTGPYFGTLTPKRQIKITATWSATDYVMFTGWVASWPQDYREAGKDAFVDIMAYDALEWTSGVRLAQNAYSNHIETIGGVEAWLQQADTTKWYDSSSNNNDAYLTGTTVLTMQPGSGPLPSGITSSTEIPFGAQSLALTTIPIGYTGLTVSMWVKTTATHTQTLVDYDDDPLSPIPCLIGITAAGLVIVDDASAEVTSTTAVNDGQWHHIAFALGDPGSDGPGTLYIDGVAEDSVAWSNVFGVHRICPNYNYYFSYAKFEGSLADLLVSTVAYSADQVADLYNYGIGFLAESSADRVARYLDEGGWPAAWRTISTGTRATCGLLTYSGQQLLTALREVEATEQGHLFAAKDGDITFLSRYAHQEVTRNNTTQATFSDDGSDFRYQSFAWVQDDTNVRNDITVATPTMQSRSQDATSQTTYGRRSETINTVLSTYEQCRDVAAGLVYWWKNAATRVEPFDVSPNTSGWATLLGLELADRIRAEITPMATGSQSVFALLVSSIEWRIDGSAWRLTLGGTPVPPSFFMIGTSEVGGADVLGF